MCLSLQQQPSQVTKKCVQIHDSSAAAAAAVFAANVWQPCLSMISWAAGGGGVLVPVEQLQQHLPSFHFLIRFVSFAQSVQ